MLALVYMRLRAWTLLFLLLLGWRSGRADELPSGQFNVAKPTIDGIPGATCLNVVTITNQTDVPWPLRLRTVIPAKLHLLSHVPPSVIVPAHGALALPIKLLVDRQWTDEEATVRVDAYEASAPLPVISALFTVQQSRTVGNVIAFSFVNDHPYLSPGQDTLGLQLQVINDNYRGRVLRLALRSVPEGFVLPALFSVLPVGARRDTIVRLPCLTRPSLQWSRTYDLIVEVYDNADGTLLGSAVCRPVLLTAVKRRVNPDERGPGQNGALAGITRLGQFGYFSELRGWGQQAAGKGLLSFRFDALSYSTATAGGRQFTDFRDTYLQYAKADGTLLRVGSLYDVHELPLMGIGVKAAVVRGNTKLEGWAVTGYNNFLHRQAQSYYSSVYSLRVSGPLPFALSGTYSFSTSRYALDAFGRVGWLQYGAAHWQPSVRSRVRLLAATSLEYSSGPVSRQQTNGWALAGDYHHAGERLTLNLSTYVSNPVYGGYQRGLSRVDNFLNYRLGTRTTLGYHLSLLQYNQHYVGLADTTGGRLFGNNIADVTLTHRFGRCGLALRPYYWQQTQTLSNMRQQTDTYRLLLSAYYDPSPNTRLELSADGGRYRGLTPATDLYAVNTYRFIGTLSHRAFSLFGLYQHGPYLINDRLPGAGDPNNTRQIVVAPNWGFTRLDGRLVGGFGANLIYTTQNRSWNGILRHSASFAVNDNLQLRWNVNLFSTARQLADLRPAPAENAQVSLEVVRQFQTLGLGSRRHIRLRFYEDENANRQRDGRDAWLAGLVVHIRSADGRETPLLTDASGQVTLKALGPGLYIVRTVCKLATGEPVTFSDSIRVSRSVERNVPIRKTWPVKGTLLYKRGRFDDNSADLESYRVEARATDGELFRTYADDGGRFTLFMPAGDYQVSVVNSRQFPPKPVLTVPYRVAAGTAPGALNLEFESAGRPVQIKRFSAR